MAFHAISKDIQKFLGKISLAPLFVVPVIPVINGLQEKNGELVAATERFGSRAVLEREARLKLNLQRPGEEVVVVREATPRPVAEAGGRGANADAGASASPPALPWQGTQRRSKMGATCDVKSTPAGTTAASTTVAKTSREFPSRFPEASRERAL